MSNPLKRIQSVAGAFGVKRSFLAFLLIGLASPAFARDLAVAGPIFNEAAARDFPQAIYEKVTAKIVHQTTFAQVGPEGLVRWSTRTLKLVDFVKAPSPTFRDTYLFAMRYLVSVISDKDSLAVYGTSCEAVVVFKLGQWDEPTVVCEPVNLGQPEQPS